MNPSPEDLRRIKILAELSDDELAWLAERTELRVLHDGEVFVRAGDDALHMHFFFEGQVMYEADLGGQRSHWVVTTGEVAGVLPRSRMTQFPSMARAIGLTRVGLLHRELFDEMERRIPSLPMLLQAVMAKRIRESAKAEEQRDRMSALGQLAAGLAHELNNPATAVRRAASDLRGRLVELPPILGGWLKEGASPEELASLERAVGAALARGEERLSPVKRGEIEDEIADWLSDQDVDRPEERAATLVEAGLRLDDLEELGRACPEGVAYLEFRLASILMLRDIEGAAKRISHLVASVKSYSHMDRGFDRDETDVRAGLESTVTMLGHKLREKNIKVVTDFLPDLPRLQADEGALNQVWTNLIDNAVDAMAPGGTLTLRAFTKGGSVAVSVIDDGPGIPPEVQARIFEPFFTTKPVGKGTGLGLDMVQRIVMRQHGGVVRASSEPGHTEFLVMLPLAAPDPAPAAPEAPAAPA